MNVLHFGGIMGVRIVVGRKSREELRLRIFRFCFVDCACDLALVLIVEVSFRSQVHQRPSAPTSKCSRRWSRSQNHNLRHRKFESAELETPEIVKVVCTFD